MPEFAQSVATAATGAVNGPQQQFLCFALGSEKCAVRIEQVREILEVVPMTPLPRMPAFVRGVMNLRGVVVPVFDLGARLGLAQTQVGRRTCIVIVDLRGQDGQTQTMGVLVDAVHEVLGVGAGEMEPVPRLGTRIDPGWIRNMVRVRGSATPELDLDTILEQRRLAELIDHHGTARH